MYWDPSGHAAVFADDIGGPTTNTNSQVLKSGDSGDDVKLLQQTLVSAGFKIAVDGVYGNETKKAVKEFQTKQGLIADGIAGSNTIGELYSISIENANSLVVAVSIDKKPSNVVDNHSGYQYYIQPKEAGNSNDRAGYQYTPTQGTGNSGVDKYGNPIVYDRSGKQIDPDVVYLMYKSPFMDGAASGMAGTPIGLVNMEQYPADWMKDLHSQGYDMGQIVNTIINTKIMMELANSYTKAFEQQGNAYSNAITAQENIAQTLRNKILSGNIVKTTGGKIDSKVITVAVDVKTGQVTFGLSGLKGNPTSGPVNPQMKKMLDNMGKSLTNYPLNNCAEYNAINNALNNGSSISNLRLYTIEVKSGAVKAPCINCSTMYGNSVNTLP